MTLNGNLSKESEQFLEDLRVYLFSSGKNSEEIDEIVDELEIHLTEAEKNGKSIEKIIGKSPKEYMEMVSNEIKIDFHLGMKYILLIIFGAFAIMILPDVLEGNVAYSVIKIVGNVLIMLIFLAMIFTVFRYISTHAVSPKMQAVPIGGIVLLNMGMFFGLIYLDRAVDSPVLRFGTIGSYVIGIVAVLFIIGMSIWAKTSILIVIVALLTLPDYVLAQTSLSYETQLTTSSFIMVAGVAIYLGIVYLKEKRDEKSD